MMKTGEIREGGHTEEEQNVQGGGTLPKGWVLEMQSLVRREAAEMTEETFSDGSNGFEFDVDAEEEHAVTEEDLALIAAGLIEQGNVEAHFVQEQAEAEEDGKEVANYETVGLLRSGTRNIAQLILAGLVWLSPSDWGMVKAHADPVTLSANQPNTDSGSGKAGTKELTGEEIIRLEREQGRNMTLDEFIKTNTCKSEAAARLWAEHQEAQRENEKRRREDPRAVLTPSPIQPEWPKEGEEGKKIFTKKGERALSGQNVNFFSIESSVQDEEGNVVVIKKFYLTATALKSVTRAPHNLFWAGFLGTDEEKAKRMASYLLAKM